MADRLADATGWYVACQGRHLRARPLARVVHGTPLVLFRDALGQVGVLEDRCPHRNAPLSQGRVVQGCLQCAYHGWQFDRDGVCREVPGLVGNPVHRSRDAARVDAVERDGLIWVRGGRAVAEDPPSLPLLDEPGYRTVVLEAVARTTVADAAENLLDGTHTAFVHGGLIQQGRRRTEVVVRRQADRVEAEYLHTRQQGWIPALFGRAVDQGFGRFLLPGLGQLEYRARGHTRLIVTACFTPTTPGKVRAFGVVTGRARGIPTWLAALVLRPLFRRIVRQDARMLRAQAEAVARFAGARFLYTEADLLGPHIRQLLAHPTDKEAEQTVELLL